MSVIYEVLLFLLNYRLFSFVEQFDVFLITLEFYIMHSDFICENL